MPSKPSKPRLSIRESVKQLARKKKQPPRARVSAASPRLPAVAGRPLTGGLAPNAPPHAPNAKKPAPPAHLVYLGLGSNLGPRKKNIAAALNALETTAGVTVEQVSSLYETDPVGGPPGQDSYINAACRLTTTLNPLRLLALCLNIEESLGRKRAIRWGPRNIDLDILAYDDLIRGSNRLTIPHPLMHERRFVMEPLAEIAPDWTHPVLGQTARDLFESLKSESP